MAAEIYENKPTGTYVTHVQARSASSVFYDIIDGNAEDMFLINPSMGVILTKGLLDYETKKFYNLTIQAVNMVRDFLNFLFFHLIEFSEFIFLRLSTFVFKGEFSCHLSRDRTRFG